MAITNQQYLKWYKSEFMEANHSLNDSTFTLLRDLINERMGVYYENDKRNLLMDKLSPRLSEQSFNSFLDYYYLLKYDDPADEEWKYVMDALSVQETFFWREIDQIKALVDVLVPQYFADYPHKTLKIWSAACATGEEPLTIAIALNEAGWFERAPIEIYASDASPSAIAKAKQGLYRERAFRNLSPTLKARYFRKEQDYWRILPGIHARIQWETANLVVETDIKRLAAVPVIFCRNVFIYFSESAISKTVQLFHAAMPTPAYLFVGASESLLKLTNDFEFQE
ncbi:MAG TPA: CheR family methyltransferase, partial [Candidatus Obscuribacterales bacterium]